MGGPVMSRRMRCLGVLLLAVGSLACSVPVLARADEDRVKEEQERLQGTWKAVSIEAGGMKLPAQQVKDFQLVLKGNQFTGLAGKHKFEGTYTVDPDKNPRRMDILPTSGPDKGKVRRAIYALQGNTLRICGAEAGKDRPTGFKTEDEAGASLIIYRRVP